LSQLHSGSGPGVGGVHAGSPHALLSAQSVHWHCALPPPALFVQSAPSPSTHLEKSPVGMQLVPPPTPPQHQISPLPVQAAHDRSSGVGGHLAFTLASATHCVVHLCHVAAIRLGTTALSVTYM
jgi:hypothetical protein